MSAAFVRRASQSRRLSLRDVAALLDQDTFSETFVPRSGVLRYLQQHQPDAVPDTEMLPSPQHKWVLRSGHAADLALAVPEGSVQCVVTSPPYWAMRIYDGQIPVAWADGEVCIYGLEQTPDAYVRHSVEIILALSRVVADGGSIWWNVSDTYNTRTQLRRSSSELVSAMTGSDTKRWGDHLVRRYSAGHSYLKDGELCGIPAMIAQRASRAGLWTKTIVTWAKPVSVPEPHQSRLGRRLEYVLHFSKRRSPDLHLGAYTDTPPELGGRDSEREPLNPSDVWMFATAAGGGGHGAQFPTALPGRCIALSSDPGSVVLDPFLGAGNSGEAALRLGRRFVGWDISQPYVDLARSRLEALI